MHDFIVVVFHAWTPCQSQVGGMKTLAHLAFGNDVNRIEVQQCVLLRAFLRILNTCIVKILKCIVLTLYFFVSLSQVYMLLFVLFSTISVF